MMKPHRFIVVPSIRPESSCVIFPFIDAFPG